MKSSTLKWISAGVTVLALVGVQPASAQGPSVSRPPTLTRPKSPSLSPYLNLIGGGNNPDAVAFQYYSTVQPQRELRQASARQLETIRGLDQELQQQRKLLMQSPTSRLGTTGHRTQFQNYGTYFKK